MNLIIVVFLLFGPTVQGCGMKDVPGGYTRVNRYVRWMMHKITDITPKVSVCNGTFGTWIGKRVGWTNFLTHFYSLFFVDTHALNKNKEHFFTSPSFLSIFWWLIGLRQQLWLSRSKHLRQQWCGNFWCHISRYQQLSASCFPVIEK